MKKILCIALAAIVTLPSFALSLIDTGKPEKLIQTGVRIGLTSSNLTNNIQDAFPDVTWKNQHWGNGFLIGGIADINLVGCFTIQPGAFIYRKANTFNYLLNDNESLNAYEGRQYCNILQVPILFSFRLGIAEIAQVQLDCGPYFAWGFGGKVKYTEYRQSVGEVIQHVSSAPYFGDGGMAKRYDVGIKTGIGILAMGRIYLGAHFSYGARNTLKPMFGTGLKGHSKVWQFTLGYNF